MDTLRFTVAAAGTALLVALTSCGGSTATPTGAATPPPEPTPAALALSEHVLSGTDLPGFVSDAEPTVQDLAAFAEEHDKDITKLERSGMVRGTTVQFEPATQAHAFALSIAAQYTTEDAAQREADRLFAANSEADPGMKVTPLEVPGIAKAQAVTKTGARKGTPYTGVEIVFVDDTVLHEVFAIGTDPVVSVASILESVQSLYAKVHGHPVA